MNRALAVHRGELIAWLDGDDVMLPGKLERQVAALDADPSAAGCSHDAEVFDSDSGRTIGRFSQMIQRFSVAQWRNRAVVRPDLQDAPLRDDDPLVVVPSRRL